MVKRPSLTLKCVAGAQEVVVCRGVLCCVVLCCVVSVVLLLARSCVLDWHRCVAGCVVKKKTTHLVHCGSLKNQICNRTQITPQKIFISITILLISKNNSAHNYGCQVFNSFETKQNHVSPVWWNFALFLLQ